MTRSTLTFDQALNFSRACTADYVDASGATVTAAVDAPRFDHDPTTHDALGLLVRKPPTIAAAEVATVRDGDWVVEGSFTILHQFISKSGVLSRAAYVSTDPRTAIDRLLGNAATHQRVVAFAYLPGDYSEGLSTSALMLSEDARSVLWGGQAWVLPGGRLDFSDPSNSILIPAVTR